MTLNGEWKDRKLDFTLNSAIDKDLPNFVTGSQVQFVQFLRNVQQVCLFVMSQRALPSHRWFWKLLCCYLPSSPSKPAEDFAEHHTEEASAKTEVLQPTTNWGDRVVTRRRLTQIRGCKQTWSGTGNHRGETGIDPTSFLSNSFK